MKKQKVSKNKELITVDQYRLNLTANLLGEVFKIIDGEEIKLGKGFSNNLTMSILTNFIYNSVYYALNRASRTISTENEKLQEYQEYKSLIQNSIAAGFELAQKDFSGRIVDYYCDILPMPEPINKEPC